MNDPKIFVRRFRETHIDLKDETGIEFVAKISGKYLVEVCRDGKVIRQPFGPQMRPNLITTNCFDVLFSNASANAFRWPFQYARVGTGTTAPTNGDLALAAQTQNTNTLFTGGGNTYSNDTVNGAWTATWVYEFTAVGAGVTLNEAGLSNTASGTAATTGMCTRVLFASGVLLNSGDNLRLTYSITISIPSIVTPITVSMAAVNGFNISGSMKTLGLFNGATNAAIFGTVSASDSSVITTTPNTQGQIVFYTTGLAWMGSAPTTFSSVNASPTALTTLGSQVTGSLGSYTNGSLTKNQTWTWITSNPSSTASNVNIITFMNGNGNAGLALILTSAQTKANTNTLAITLSCTMVRA